MPVYDEIPTLRRFRRDAGLGMTIGGHRTGTTRRTRMALGTHRGLSPVVLETLCDLVRDYHDSERYAVLKHLDLLGQMYIAGRFWLREGDPEDASRPAVQALFDVCKEALCEIFGCAEDTLKDELKEWFGKSLDEGMGEGEADLYPERDETAKYRLEFRNGRAYMLDWFRRPEVPKLIPANSRHLENTQTTTPGFAGYVMVLGNRILMAKHRESGEEGGKFAHSFYKQGRTILCAGEIAIVDGRVICVNNSSGHYKPAAEKMIHVVRCLRFNGVDLRGVVLNLRTNQDSNYYEAQAFLVSGGNLTGLRPLDGRRVRQMVSSVPGWLQGVRTEHMAWDPGGPAPSDQELLGLYFRD